MSSVATIGRGGLVPLDDMDPYLYMRVSSDEQADEGVSLANQEHRGLTYIAQKNWRHAKTYTDVLSGRRDDRPGYQAVLREIRGAVVAGRRPVLVVNMLDRLGRSVAERARAWNELIALGVPLHVVDMGGEVPEFIYNVLASVAQEESRLTSQRVRQVRERARELGWHDVGRASWGYRWRPATEDERRQGAPKSVLEIHPDEAPYVREAWERLASGTSLCEIARWAPSLPSVARGNRNLNFGVLRELFRSPVYVGRHGNGDDVDTVLDRPVGRWEALISDETWRAVRASVDKEKRKLPAQASGQYLLTGFIRCDRCGSRMGGTTKKTTHKKSHIHRQYVCTGNAMGTRAAGTCRSHAVAADGIEAAVIATVSELLAIANEPKVIDAAKAAWADVERRYRSDPSVERIGALDREIVKTRGRMQRNHTLFVDGDITKDAYVTSQAEYQRDLDALDAERARCAGRTSVPALPPFYAVLESVKGWARAFVAGDAQARRAALAEVLESVRPVPTGKLGRYEIEPTWTATGTVLLRTAIRFGASANVAHVERFGTSNLSTSATASAA